MKRILITLFCFSWFFSPAQNIQKKLKKVKTVNDAFDFKDKNSELQPELITLRQDTVIFPLYKKLLEQPDGSITVNGDFTYKNIEAGETSLMRVSYIFLNGNELSRSATDSIRTIIMERHKKGDSFDLLAKEYNMDGNTDPDLNWFSQKTMVSEFEEGVRTHQKGEIFTVDVPYNSWYYVVLKTHADRTEKSLLVLRVKNNP